MPRHGRPAEVMLEASTAVAAGEDVGRSDGQGVRVMVEWLAFSASRATAVSHPTVSLCGGLVPEGATCTPQPVVQRDSISRFSVGYVLSRVDGDSRFLSIPYVGVALMRQHRTGLYTGERRGGELDGGPVIGYTTGVQHNLFGGLWLGIMADAALILPWNPGGCYDCSPAYEDAIGSAGLSLTASWRLP